MDKNTNILKKLSYIPLIGIIFAIAIIFKSYGYNWNDNGLTERKSFYNWLGLNILIQGISTAILAYILYITYFVK